MVKVKGAEEYPIYFGASVEMLRLAGDLRRTMTSSEKKIWPYLRSKALSGHRFRRQHPIKDFIVDFFCYDVMLAVEIDGEVHQEAFQKERDKERTVILNKLGIRVLRFTNSEIEHQIDAVIDTIQNELKIRSSYPSPGWGKGRDRG